jgi:hypothetical protein
MADLQSNSQSSSKPGFERRKLEINLDHEDNGIDT